VGRSDHAAQGPGAELTVREGLERRATELTSRASARVHRLPFLDLLEKIWVRFRAANGTILAGYLAYRLFLLIMPLIVIVVALAGYNHAAADTASGQMRLGASLASTIAHAGQDAHKSRGPLLVVGLVGFVTAAWGFLGALQFTAAQAWQIPTRKFVGKTKVFLRLSGSLLLFGGILYLAAAIRKAGALVGVAGSITVLVGAFVAYLGIGWILPRRSKEWYWLLPGAAFGAACNVGMQALATFYLPDKLGSASKTYGAFGIVLTLFSYLYLLGLLLAMTVIINAVVWEHFDQEPPNILRRIAARIPIPTTTFGSGYVPPGEGTDTTISPPIASSGGSDQ
jgi:YihY family inner membrane protein